MSPKEQCEVLLDKLLPFAEDQMKKYREFYPFAAVILMDDSVELTGSYDGNEHPESKDVLADLIQIHKQLAAEDKIKASGIVWNAGIASADGNPTDAIIVSLEHKDDYSVIVGEPYKVGLSKRLLSVICLQWKENTIFFKDTLDSLQAWRCAPGDSGQVQLPSSPRG